MKGDQYADAIDRRFHPDSLLRELLREAGKEWAKFNQEPVDPDYFALWVKHFDRLFREEPGLDQNKAIFAELRRRGFTNLQLRTAAEHIVSRCRKWPFVADFLEGVKDSNEQA